MNEDKPPKQNAIGRKAVVYYTDNRCPPTLSRHVPKRIEAAADAAQALIIAVVQRPLDWPEACVVDAGPRPRELRSVYEQILIGLAEADARGAHYCFFAEHAVLYPPDAFFGTPCSLTYNVNLVRMSHRGYMPVDGHGTLLSQLQGPTAVLREAIQSRQEALRRNSGLMWAEPGVDDEYKDKVVRIETHAPAIDVRYGGNLTGPREAPEYLTKLPYWGRHDELWRSLFP
jgi:hypothetical protein